MVYSDKYVTLLWLLGNNMSRNRNKITKMGGGVEIKLSAFVVNSINIITL